ncbi:hypothetical protein [Brevibacillus reuszeri]|uniref:hypothetical protein n=1 Tax=Brevibacillus reuszeri TaxID=54915 RepID=UPI0013E081CA|nr:hypothetical protein [Brevibacillus reuszeri]
MRKRHCPLLRRIEERGEIFFGDLIKGVYFSDDEQVQARLEDYRERGMIECKGKRLTEITVIKVRRKKRGKIRGNRPINKNGVSNFG